MPLGYYPRVAAPACFLPLCFAEWLGALVHWLSSFHCLRLFKPTLKKSTWINRAGRWKITLLSSESLWGLVPGSCCSLEQQVSLETFELLNEKKYFPTLFVSGFNLEFCPNRTSQWCPCLFPQSLEHTSLKAISIYCSSRCLHAWLWKCRNSQNMVPAQRAALHT